MVTQAVARKHKEELARMEYLESLGQAPVYTGNPTPPITAESVFGHTSPPSPTIVNDSMDVDNVTFTPVELSPPPPIIGSDNNFPLHHHPILEDDFQPDTDLEDPLCPLEPYNEDLETLAVEEELHAFSEIRYGLSTLKSPLF